MLTDDLDRTVKKVRRAVTDSGSEVRFDPVEKPGVSNLLSILGACTGRDPAELATEYPRYGPLKDDTAEAVVELLRPIQERFAVLRDDRAETERLLRQGADKAAAVAVPVLSRALAHIGLLPRT
jgi:tryptophanyl-tRNA synthetase